MIAIGAASLPVAALADGRMLAPCYQVTVVTQDVGGAGTDANITATFTNYQGASAQWVLNSTMPGNAFERGATDTAVYCTDVPLGNAASLSLYSDGSYAGSAWDVAMVTIAPLGVDDGHLTSMFQFFTTIDDNETKSASNMLPSSDDWDQFKVTIHTGTRSGSGTDANVWLQVKGVDGITDKTRLNALVSGNAFENGDTNEFTFLIPQKIGNPDALTFELEGAYAGNDWYVPDVLVTGRSGTPVRFTIDKFLTTDMDPKLQGTFSADMKRRILTAKGDLGEDMRLVPEVQVQHNISGATSRPFKFTFTSGVENSIELMNGSNDTNTQSVSVTGRVGADSDIAAVSVTAGLEFSQEVQQSVTQGLTFANETSTEQLFDIPPNSIMFVECTWAIPQRQTRVSDGQEDFVLRVASGVPQLNCGPNLIGPGGTVSTDLQAVAAKRMSDWAEVKQRAIAAGIIMQ